MFKITLNVCLNFALLIFLTVVQSQFAFGENKENALFLRLQKILKTSVTHHGPNCWNSALVGSGLLSHIRFTSASEFLFLINSSACKQIPSGQQQAGDIQSYVRSMPELNSEWSQVHANILLDEMNAFNKMTNYSTSKYEITEHQQVNLKYDHTSEVLRFNLENPIRVVQCQDSGCINKIEYYRCNDLTMLKLSDVKYSKEAEALIEKLETNIEKQIQSPLKETSESKNENEVLLKNVESIIQSNCNIENTFYCQLLKEEVGSIRWQFKQVQPNWIKDSFKQ